MRIVTLIILIATYSSCSSQRLKEGCWMPEFYIDSLQTKAFDNLSHLIRPVESILVSGDTIFIMSYHSEYLIAKTRKVDKNRLQITNFSNLINLNFPSAIAYTKEKCFIYSEKNYLVLQIGKNKSMQRIRFRNSYDGLLFNNADEVIYRYRLTGKYRFNDKTIELKPDGEIEGTNLWKSYRMLRHGYNSVDGAGRQYNLMFFEGEERSTYAVKIEKNELLFFQFSSLDKGDYLLKLSDVPAHVLKRINP